MKYANMMRKLNAKVTTDSGYSQVDANALTQAIEIVRALDDDLVCAHLGTLDSFPTYRHAIEALVDFDKGVDKYFAQEKESREFWKACAVASVGSEREFTTKTVADWADSLTGTFKKRWHQ
jgi:hypothetical protein